MDPAGSWELSPGDGPPHRFPLGEVNLVARCNLDPVMLECDCTGLQCFTGTVDVFSSGGVVSGTLTTQSGTVIRIQQTQSLCGPSLLSVNGTRASLCGTFVLFVGQGVLDVTMVFVPGTPGVC